MTDAKEITHHAILAAAEGLHAANAFTGTIALGIQGVPRKGETSWAVVEFTNGNAGDPAGMVTGTIDPETNVEAAEEDTADQSQVVLWISGKPSDWEEASKGLEGFLRVVGRKGLLVVGEVPFFIRQMESLTKVLKGFADALSN